MFSEHDLPGRVSQFVLPDWQPLRDLVGLELADWFMWMHEIELYDGTYLQAYKHTATRRYLHLAEDGRAFLCLRGDAYTPVARRTAIDLAFECWKELCPEEEHEATSSALHRAREAADEQLER